MLENKILESAKLLYNYKLEHKNKTNLAKRCNNFLLLEKKTNEYKD